MSSSTGHKVVLLGDSGVGKTAIVIQLNEGAFRKNTMPTVGSGIYAKEIETDEGPVSITIWDTAGEERYRSFTGLYSQGAGAAIVVFDVTDDATFQNLASWIDIFHASSPSTIIYVLGNKIDKEGSREVDYEKAFEWAKKNGCRYSETSAKTGENIEFVFKEIAKELSKTKCLMMTTTLVPTTKSSTQKKSSCC